MKENRPKVVEVDHVVSLEEWLLLILLSFIPILNVFYLGYFSFKRNINKNKRNFIRAAFIYVLMVYILIMLSTFLR